MYFFLILTIFHVHSLCKSYVRCNSNKMSLVFQYCTSFKIFILDALHCHFTMVYNMKIFFDILTKMLPSIFPSYLLTLKYYLSIIDLSILLPLPSLTPSCLHGILNSRKITNNQGKFQSNYCLGCWLLVHLI